MADYPTPHIKASPEDFAKTVLMPGDPLRSKFIAENFLEDAKLVNNVRGVQGCRRSASIRTNCSTSSALTISSESARRAR